jgi:uncharacterized protein YndB with AHSA1/START domain
MSSQTLNFSQAINAPARQVYRAFTNSTALRQWLCDVATLQPRPGGRLYLWWHSGYYTSGEFTALEPDTLVSFSWRGRGEPQPTQVHVAFSEQDGVTRVTLEHRAVGEGPEWSQARQEIAQGWRNGLENLKSALETGEDQRFTLRPMLGITVSDFNADVAQKMGVPVSQGIRLDSLIDGMGAQAAGLQDGDVVVAVAGHPITDFASLSTALQGRRAGDKVDVSYYRGPAKMATVMQLSRRPLPTITWHPAELAEAVRQRNHANQATLAQFLESVTEAEASTRPSPDEWSVKEILAHFIHGERGYQHYNADRVGGHEAHYDDYAGNINAQVEATVAAYPTVADLLAEYRRAQTETVEFIARLPQEFIANKPAYWQTAYELLQDDYHFNTHLEQMKKAVEAARK